MAQMRVSISVVSKIIYTCTAALCFCLRLLYTSCWRQQYFLRHGPTVINFPHVITQPPFQVLNSNSCTILFQAIELWTELIDVKISVMAWPGPIFTQSSSQLKSLQDLYMFIIWGKPQISDWKLRWWKLAIAIHTFLIYILVYLGFETENLDEESWWLWGEINSSFNSAWGQNNLLLKMM